MTTYSVHDEPGFERVYDEDEMISIRRGDLRALLDLSTSSMDFGSGFWDNEQTEIARKIAGVLGVDPMIVTPANFSCQYGGPEQHQWVPAKDWGKFPPGVTQFCVRCRHTNADLAGAD